MRVQRNLFSFTKGTKESLRKNSLYPFEVSENGIIFAVTISIQIYIMSHLIKVFIN
ncbi:hypothetical protein EZS27_005479 [termite gut metagenome]|uniref:Uncharacterized protein n=1 Tax=termite gut metagenome TaxID=433724 RepID=A0A5J4SMA9_9ZZZZ